MRYLLELGCLVLLLVASGCKKKGQDDSNNSNGGNGGVVCYLTLNTIQTPEGIFPISLDTSYLSPNNTWYVQWLVNDTVGVGIDFSESTEPLSGDRSIISDFGQLDPGTNRAFVQVFVGSKTYVAQDGTLTVEQSNQLEFCQRDCKDQNGAIGRFSLKATLK